MFVFIKRIFFGLVTLSSKFPPKRSPSPNGINVPCNAARQTKNIPQIIRLFHLLHAGTAISSNFTVFTFQHSTVSEVLCFPEGQADTALEFSEQRLFRFRLVIMNVLSLASSLYCSTAYSVFLFFMLQKVKQA